MDSSAACMTLQGKAIKQAAIDFGNGQTLPFTPCKKGFIPLIGKERRFACPLHNKAREKRLAREQGKFRPGEVDLNLFRSKLKLKSETKVKSENTTSQRKNVEKIDKEMA
jgi:hypothetical protein